MDVKLYYIHGISRIDTPYFATKTSQATLSKQEEFFSNHLVQSVELSFYPPHYHNTIKFDTEDITFNTNVNYLSLEYNNKTYYYFIDSINYISESIIELEITMDTIQTYMFDIYIANGVIERKFINRFYQRYGSSDWLMNRNYIRENVGSGEFIVKDKQILNSDVSKYVLFLKQSKFDKSTTYGNICPRNTISYWLDSSNLAPKFPISLAVPYDIKFGPGSPYGFVKNDANKVAFNTFLVATGSYLAETLDMYVCPFNPFMKISMSSPSAGNVTLSGDVTDTAYLNFDDMHGETVYYNKGLNDKYDLAIRKYTFIIAAVKNSGFVDYGFSSDYMPQMVDDNYMRYTFGTDACLTSHPLYTVEQCLSFHYAFDVTNGSRIYFINDNNFNTNTDDDFYSTMVIDTNILSVDLKNTPWAQYIANNKNRWAQLNTNNILSISSAAASYAGGSSAIGKIGVDKTSSTRYSYAKVQGRNKKGQFTRGVMRKVGTDKVSSSRDVYGDVPTNPNAGGIAGAALGAVGDIFNQYYTEKNLLAAPSTLSQLGECINGLLSHSHLIYYKQEKVIDFEQCANYYHRNGYLVNEYVNNVENIFEYVQNRWHFNILKMSIAEVHLHNVIEDDDTIDSIKQRLEDGIRLWNINNQQSGTTVRPVIGNFYYDNVENDFIQ